MTLSNRIKRLRQAHKMSQVELAERLNTTKQTIYKYENGIVTNIPSDKIELMAKIFNVSPAYLMGWDTEDDVLSMPQISELSNRKKTVLNAMDSDENIEIAITTLANAELTPEQNAAVAAMIKAYISTVKDE